MCARYLDQCREALGFIWGRKLGLHAREIRLIDVSVTVALEAC